MDIFPLAIFPEDSLSSSIIPAVWVGMSVVCFFNLRLGWVLSGLVVPGYLIPLMLIKPWAAGVVLLEGILTYFIIWFLSEYLSRWAHWCNFFGRDRFFALVLCSIVIRLLLDGWLLPKLGEWTNNYWHIAFDYRNNLHSFGLIIVSLIANQFWKTGFIRGLIPLTVTLLLTLLIVRYGLMEFTNYSLSSVSYLYEELATSILSTPKSYIILVFTAFLASRMNLYYGWDFNGILIPSLLALQWYQPIKILATIIESTLILWLAIMVLKIPPFRAMTIEGARKLLLFFNVSFAYKIILSYTILACFPAVKVSDYFGFGYLLSTLMALKIHDKAIFARLTRATLQTSFVAVIGANILGFILTQLPIPEFFASSNEEDSLLTANTQTNTTKNLDDWLKQEQVNSYKNKLTQNFIAPLPAEIELFARALNELHDYLKTSDVLKLQKAIETLSHVHYCLEQFNNGRYLYLHEQVDEQTALRGWGVYIIDTKAQSELALEIPAALNESGIFNAGVGLFKGLGTRSLAIASSSRKSAGDVLTLSQSFFQVFHRIMNRNNTLQLRLYNSDMALASVRRSSETIELTGLTSGLWVKERLPIGLDLSKLKQLLIHFDIHWTKLPFHNQQRELSTYGFAELVLTQADLHKLLESPLLLASKDASLQNIEQTLSLEGYLQQWLLTNKQTIIAGKGSQLYQPPRQEELLFLDEEVITPLLAIVRHSQLTNNASVQDDAQLQALAQAAYIIGYHLIHYHDKASQQNYLILAEQEGSSQRYWGTYVFRLGNANPYGVQIPHPLFEINSVEYGVALFAQLNAQSLMIGATHPDANLDGSADLVHPSNRLSVFNLVNQILLREAGETNLMQISVRAFSYQADKPFPDADVILSLANGIMPRDALLPLPRALLEKLEKLGLKVQLLDGSEQTSGFEVNYAAQSLYLAATAQKDFAILWLSPNVRASYRQQNDNLLQQAQFNSLNIASSEQDLTTYLAQQVFSQQAALSEEFRTAITQYVVEQDVTRLQQALSYATAQGYSLSRIIDRNSKQAFILYRNKDGNVLGLINLAARQPEYRYLDEQQSLAAQITDFINQRQLWLRKQAH